MLKRSERSLVLFAVLFAFACLLLSGGSRLIGHEGEEPAPSQSVSFVNAVLCAAPAPIGEMGHTPVRMAAAQHTAKASCPVKTALPALVCSDANGNILRGSSYLKEVHQAFSLGDGFV